MERRLVWIAGCACVAAVAGIRYATQASVAAHARATVAVQRPAVDDGIERPPLGRWRLARPEALDHVVMFFEHILVRHAESESCEAPFSAAQWCTMPTPPARTPEQALALARVIAEQARAAADTFPMLVERYSEDVLSRQHGGSLGALPASQLMTHASVLDALAALKPGEISGVVASSYGFHVLRRVEPPAARDIAGRHLVLGNDQTPWLAFHARADHPLAKRTRVEARALAARVKAEIEAQPQAARIDAFAARVAELSEHRDAAQSGDLGVWSSREPTSLRWQLEALATLGIGEISAPIETPLGTELVQRVPVTPRSRVAMEAIKLRFDPDVGPDQPLSRQAVLAQAQTIATYLQDQPDHFVKWQKQYCCAAPDGWSEGRGDAELTTLLETLPVGAIATRPIVVEHNVVIARRIAAFDPPAIAFEPPSPSQPDLEYLVRNASAAGAKRYLSTLTAAVTEALPLTEYQRALVERTHRKLGDELEAKSSDARVDALYAAQGALRDQLGDTLFERYLQVVRAEVTKLLLTQRG